MHITAICPRCQSQYQVEPELRGKRMRCPNVICRAVFEVGAEPGTVAATSPAVAETQPPAPPSPAVRQPSPPAPSAFATIEKQNWEQAPPPVRQSSTAAARAPVTTDGALDDFPIDAPSTPTSTAAEAAVALKPTPKRSAKPQPSGTADGSSASAAVLPTVEPRQARRRSLVAILTMLALLAGGLALGLWRIGARHAELEEERFQEALAHYDNEEFDQAVTLLQQLDRDYPTSDRQATYRFLAELGDVRQAVATPPEDSAELLRTYQRLQEFLAVYQNDPLLKDRHGDVWQALYRMATQLVAEAERAGDKAFLTLAQRAWKEAGKYQAPPGTSVAEAEGNLQKDVARIEQSLARHEERRRLSELLAAWTTEASAARLRQARRLVRLAKFDEDAEFKTQLQRLIDAHRAQITFVPAQKPATPPDENEDDMLYLAAVPPVGKVEAAPGRGTIVLALARGILYALDSKTGNLVWARRIGVDVSETPLRIAAEADLPERAFVVSSDSRVLAAVDLATGAKLWRHQLDGVCLARPLLVDGKLLVPTLAGRIEEVDAASGRFLGAWQLDQPLTHGGVALAGSNMVYFAGAADCVYALDRANGVCAGVLYTGHVWGDLTVPPLAWTDGAVRSGADAPQTTAPSGWLALPRGDAEGNTRIDVWPLPWTHPEQAPVAEAAVAGRTWFPPWQAAGKLVLATDAGRLGLFGIRLPGNRDPLLFPWLKEHPLLDGSESGGRALIAHAGAGSAWVLTQGELQRVDSTFTEKLGPGVTPRWAEPPALGVPVHAAQSALAPDGRTTLYLTTQRADGADVFCSAVDADTGRVLWRRQLGVVALAPPLAWGKRVVLRDAGGLFVIDRQDLSAKKTGWRAAGARLVADSNEQIVAVRDDGSLLRLGWSGQTLTSQTFNADQAAPSPEASITLAAPLAGPPALHASYAVAALRNGVVVRIDLTGATAAAGPDWRASGADEQAEAHVVPAGPDLFAITDGSRGVQLVHWPDAKSWSKKAAVTLAHRIIAPPAVLGAGDPAKVGLAVADASDAVTLLEGAKLTALRRWSLGGKITHGPLVCGDGIVCVLDGRRVVWLDPAASKSRWEYPCAARLAGTPRWSSGKLWIADVGGAVTALDPVTGAASGSGFSFRADVAPTATPLPLDDGRLLIPLSDGAIAVR